MTNSQKLNSVNCSEVLSKIEADLGVEGKDVHLPGLMWSQRVMRSILSSKNVWYEGDCSMLGKVGREPKNNGLGCLSALNEYLRNQFSSSSSVNRTSNEMIAENQGGVDQLRTRVPPNQFNQVQNALKAMLHESLSSQDVEAFFGSGKYNFYTTLEEKVVNSHTGQLELKKGSNVLREYSFESKRPSEGCRGPSVGAMIVRLRFLRAGILPDSINKKRRFSNKITILDRLFNFSYDKQSIVFKIKGFLTFSKARQWKFSHTRKRLMQELKKGQFFLDGLQRFVFETNPSEQTKFYSHLNSINQQIHEVYQQVLQHPDFDRKANGSFENTQFAEICKHGGLREGNQLAVWAFELQKLNLMMAGGIPEEAWRTPEGKKKAEELISLMRWKYFADSYQDNTPWGVDNFSALEIVKAISDKLLKTYEWGQKEVKRLNEMGYQAHWGF